MGDQLHLLDDTTSKNRSDGRCILIRNRQSIKLNYCFSVSKLSTKVLRKSKGAKTRKGDTLLVWYEGSLDGWNCF